MTLTDLTRRLEDFVVIPDLDPYGWTGTIVRCKLCDEDVSSRPFDEASLFRVVQAAMSHECGQNPDRT